MSESNFSFTTKINGDLFTIRGNSAEELTQNFADAVSENVISYVVSFQKLIQETQDTPTTVSTKPVVQQPIVKEHEIVTATFPTPMQCKHGVMNWKEGIAGPKAKNPGKPYKMWVCPSRDRDDECKPIWAGN